MDNRKGIQNICFRLSRNQISWMRGLFAAEGWGWPEVQLPADFRGELVEEVSDSEAYTSSEEDVEASVISSSDEDEEPNRSQPGPSNTRQVESPRSTTPPEQGGQQDPQPGPSNTDQRPECPECFMRPCIIERHVGELGQKGAFLRKQKPRRENARVRMNKYKRFWSQIKNKGGWKDERYLARKRMRMLEDGVSNSKREVMPDCVTALVRDCYPNPPNVPYCGHEWYGT